MQGIWSGLIGGTAVQTLVLAYLTARCDWDEEVSIIFFLFDNKLFLGDLKLLSQIYSNYFLLCCAFAGKESKYTNASMGQLKMKPRFLTANIGAQQKDHQL